MPTQLILIRHGQTVWNRKKKYCGLIDVELSPLGRLQARKLRSAIKGMAINRVYASDRRRACQTARIVFGRRPVIRVPALREISFGVFEGLTHEQILKDFGALYRKWINEPFSVRIPEAEYVGSFRKRVVAALNAIARKHRNQTVAVVCHGGVISAYLTHICRTKDFWRRIPGSASLTIVEIKNRTATVALFNDISHLQETT